MEHGQLFSNQNAEYYYNLHEKWGGALGHFIYPIFKKAIYFCDDYESIFSPYAPFYSAINPGHAHSLYRRCGNGAYMGIAHIGPDGHSKEIELSFVLGQRDWDVERALTEHLDLYGNREQFADIVVTLPADFLFSKGKREKLISGITMDICIKEKKETIPFDFEIFREKLRKTKRAAETTRSGADSISNIFESIKVALRTPKVIAEIWK